MREKPIYFQGTPIREFKPLAWRIYKFWSNKDHKHRYFLIDYRPETWMMEAFTQYRHPSLKSALAAMTEILAVCGHTPYSFAQNKEADAIAHEMMRAGVPRVKLRAGVARISLRAGGAINYACRG